MVAKSSQQPYAAETPVLVKIKTPELRCIMGEPSSLRWQNILEEWWRGVDDVTSRAFVVSEDPDERAFD